MKQKLIRNVLPIALSIFLVIGMMLISTAENTGVLLASEPAATTLGSSIKNDWSWMTVNDTKENTSVINFAGHEWYVVGYNGNQGGVATTSGAITLLAVNEFGEATKFNNSTTGVQNEYYNSNLRTVLTTRLTGIDERERSAMVNRLLDGVAGQQPTDQLWALSLDEAKSLNQNLRLFVQVWWLRSKAEGTDNKAAYVNGFNGTVGDVGSYVTTNTYRVRPAFNLNLSSVLFASAAEGGKSAAIGQDLSAVTVPGLKAKLTVIDSNTANLNLTVAQDVYSGIEGRTYAPGDAVEIAYSGAKTAGNKYVSCVIANSEGKVIHYGKLSQAEIGIAKFTVPALEDGNYTIHLFNEECSADSDKKSDYASAPVEISMTIEKPVATHTVTLPTGTGYTATAQDGSTSPVKSGGSYSFKVELDSEYSKSQITVKANGTPVTPVDGVYTISNIMEEQIVTVEGVKPNPVHTATDWSWMTVNDTKDKTTVINFGGHEWYVVGYNGNQGGVATTSGAITLLAVNEFGEATKFNNLTTGVQNEYYNSNLRTVLTTRLTGIDERERSAMVNRLLDGVAGQQPTDQLWALSLDEAKSLNQNLRMFVQLWWLRSKAEGTDNKAAYVNGFNGTVADVGNYVTVATYRVRPAFNLNLSSVLFASAAEGGKAAAIGQDLSAVTAPGLKAKLTVIDSNTDNLNLTVAQDVYIGIEGRTYAPGDTVEIAYSSAKTSPNKYVSCVIENSEGKVIHYGKLLQAESGIAKFNVPALEDSNYTIHLFNEECSADIDKKSDYASKPVEISMTVYNPHPTYIVTLPTGRGYTATAQSGSSSPVDRDGSYSFKVELAPEYNQSVIIVKANETTLTPDGNDVYTISNIVENQIITVTGVKKNALPSATATLNIQKDDAEWIGHGKSFTLKLSTDANITAQMIGTDGTIQASVPYGTWKIYEGSDDTGMTITVGSTGGTETLNYYTVKFSVVDAGASK